MVSSAAAQSIDAPRFLARAPAFILRLPVPLTESLLFVALTVHEDNTVARGLYRSLGFTETGERDDDELVMVLPADG